MHWFRRNQKMLLAVLVMVLMVSWGALPAMRYFSTRKIGERGVILGKSVSQQDIQQAIREVEVSLRYSGVWQLVPREVPMFVFEGREGRRTAAANFESGWRYLVLAREAEAAGIRVTDSELDAFRLPPEELDLRRVALTLLRISKLCEARAESVHMGVSDMWMQYCFYNESTKVKFVELKPEVFLPVTEVKPEEIRAFYDKHKDQQPDVASGKVGYQAPQQARFEYALASIAECRKQASVTDAEVQDYYAKHKQEFVVPKEEPKEPAGGRTGTKPEGEKTQPAQQAPAGKSEGGAAQPQTGEAGGAQPAPAEAAPPAEKKPEAPAAAPAPAGKEDKQPDGAGAAPAAAAAAPEARPAPEAATAEPQTKETPAPAEQPRYKPLEEVKDQIRQKLLETKASNAADQTKESVLGDLQHVADEYLNMPLPLEQMAKRHGMSYVRARSVNGTEWLSREDVSALGVAGAEMARRIFEEEADINYYCAANTADGPVVFQVLERKQPEARPFEEVAEQVKADIRRQKALGEAETLANKIKARAAETSLEQAAREFDDRLVNLVGKPQAAPAPQKGDAGPAASPDKGEAKQAAAPEEKKQEPAPAPAPETQPKAAELPQPAQEPAKPVYLRVQEADSLSRTRPFTTALAAPRRALVDKALEIDVNELATVVERDAQPACYVIQKMGVVPADPNRFYEQLKWQLPWATLTAQYEVAQGWLHGMLEKSPLPRQREK
jgi:hypothetical protein